MREPRRSSPSCTRSGASTRSSTPGHYGLSKQQLRARAEEIAKGNWASEAVRKAIEEIIAAVAATSAATAASAGSG